MDKNKMFEDMVFINSVIHKLGALATRTESYNHSPFPIIRIESTNNDFSKKLNLKITIEKSKEKDSISMFVTAIQDEKKVELDLHAPILLDMLKKSNQFDAKLDRKFCWLTGQEPYPTDNIGGLDTTTSINPRAELILTALKLKMDGLNRLSEYVEIIIAGDKGEIVEFHLSRGFNDEDFQLYFKIMLATKPQVKIFEDCYISMLIFIDKLKNEFEPLSINNLSKLVG